MNMKYPSPSSLKPDPLAMKYSQNEAIYAELIEAERRRKYGSRQLFTYAPERFGAFISASNATSTDGVYAPVAPELIPITHNLTSLVNRRLINLTGLSLSISCSMQIENGFYTDTSTGDILTPVRFLMGYVPYSQNGVYDALNISGAAEFFYPIFQANLGNFNWSKTSQTFTYVPFNQTYNLLDTIPERLFGSTYRDFTTYDGRITDSDLKLLTDMDLMLIIGIIVETQGSSANTNFITLSGGNYPSVKFRVSYSFNYYASITNFDKII